jgi:hypothetical protein
MDSMRPNSFLGLLDDTFVPNVLLEAWGSCVRSELKVKVAVFLYSGAYSLPRTTLRGWQATGKNEGEALRNKR